ncbi:hypothetical protein [Streptomyces sp. 35G-GA-8]|uniref:hypothetical protein n=1 Tax=Streptomyces sp. 35G-GA-8 TaxID=2939434 RepID=UPI00201EE9FC|nr:hypothetical protein [Streptomyces sp. 35G-GA-8]
MAMPRPAAIAVGQSAGDRVEDRGLRRQVGERQERAGGERVARRERGDAGHGDQFHRRQTRCVGRTAEQGWFKVGVITWRRWSSQDGDILEGCHVRNEAPVTEVVGVVSSV